MIYFSVHCDLIHFHFIWLYNNIFDHSHSYGLKLKGTVIPLCPELCGQWMHNQVLFGTHNYLIFYTLCIVSCINIVYYDLYYYPQSNLLQHTTTYYLKNPFMVKYIVILLYQLITLNLEDIWQVCMYCHLSVHHLILIHLTWWICGLYTISYITLSFLNLSMYLLHITIHSLLFLSLSLSLVYSIDKIILFLLLAPLNSVNIIFFAST